MGTIAIGLMIAKPAGIEGPTRLSYKGVAETLSLFPPDSNFFRQVFQSSQRLRRGYAEGRRETHKRLRSLPGGQPRDRLSNGVLLPLHTEGFRGYTDGN